MSGLLALLDDVAAITKIAASHLDDIAAQATKAGAKAAGVVIDDAAVTPKYVTGLPAARELPIVWKIARASLFNKLVILLPIALVLNSFAPWLLTPLLMIGGAYLCFEGAEKIWHAFFQDENHHISEDEPLDAAHLEEERVKGAIKTDFILSAEIMTISLASIETPNVWLAGASLAIIAIGITAAVYGAVALLVKADDAGLKLIQIGRLEITRSIGRAIVTYMPAVMSFISIVGTAAMLWVGGNIIVHGLHDLGFHLPYDYIKQLASSLTQSFDGFAGFGKWLVTATADGVLGLLIGIILMTVLKRFMTPILTLFTSK